MSYLKTQFEEPQKVLGFMWPLFYVKDKTSSFVERFSFILQLVVCLEGKQDAKLHKYSGICALHVQEVSK